MPEIFFCLHAHPQVPIILPKKEELIILPYMLPALLLAAWLQGVIEPDI